MSEFILHEYESTILSSIRRVGDPLSSINYFNGIEPIKITVDKLEFTKEQTRNIKVMDDLFEDISEYLTNKQESSLKLQICHLGKCFPYATTIDLENDDEYEIYESLNDDAIDFYLITPKDKFTIGLALHDITNKDPSNLLVKINPFLFVFLYQEEFLVSKLRLTLNAKIKTKKLDWGI